LDWRNQELLLGKVLSPREVKVTADALSKAQYAKKIRTTPRTKNCIPSSSNLTKTVNALKIFYKSLKSLVQRFATFWIWKMSAFGFKFDLSLISK